MTDQSDVRHASPVSQAGFTMIPNVVMLRADLSPTAKLIYGYLKHLAWRGRGETADPPIDTIAADLCVGRRAVLDAMAALRGAPVIEGRASDDGTLVESVRRGQGRTNAYLIHDPQDPSPTPERQSRSAEKALLEVPNLPVPARGRSLPESSKSKNKTQALTGLEPDAAEYPVPADVKIDGRSLPFDTLREVCGIDPESPRCTQVGVALGGPKGIRALFWIEVKRWATDNDALERLAAMEPEEFAEALSRQIRKKAEIFTTTAEVALTPTALQKYWFEPDALRRTPKKTTGVTGDDIRAMGRRGLIDA